MASSEVETPHNLVTEDHVRAALIMDKGTDARLTNWKVVDFTKKGDNYACVVTSVEVKYVLDDQSSQVVYVVKLKSSNRFATEDNINEIIFEKEAKFYLILAPEINSILKEIGHREINFPKCLHASLEKGKEILFLEDLRPRGYKMLDRRRGMDETHATLVLRELARLHAASLLLQSKIPDEDFKAQHQYLQTDWYEMTRTCESMLDIFKNGVQFVKEIINKVGGYKRVTGWINTIIPNLVDIFYEQLECGEPKVVCHGDCWKNNLLFSYNEAGHPEDLMLLDLQMVRHATPATNLNYFLFSSMTGNFRKPNTEIFLSSYYSAFSCIMEDGGQKVPFTKGQLLKDFRDKNLFGIIFGIIALPLAIVESDDDAIESSKEDGESVDCMLKKRRQKMLNMLDSDPIVKLRCLAVFDEIIEMGLTE